MHVSLVEMDRDRWTAWPIDIALPDSILLPFFRKPSLSQLRCASSTCPNRACSATRLTKKAHCLPLVLTPVEANRGDEACSAPTSRRTEPANRQQHYDGDGRRPRSNMREPIHRLSPESEGVVGGASR